MAALELEARLDNLLSTAQEETKDIDLFAPIAEREECPICLIPLPFDENEIIFMPCCGKSICAGCRYKQSMTELGKKGANRHSLKENKCPFCQQQNAKMNHIKSLRKLMKKKNPEAFSQMATEHKSGEGVFQSDTKSLEMLIHAAELGHANAFVNIGCHYEEGTVVEHNRSKTLEFYEVAAKKGSLSARKFLVMFHGMNGDMQTSIKHCKVGACAGDQESMGILMANYKDKLLSKEDLTQILHAFQTSKNAMKSKDRDDVHDAIVRYNNRDR